MDIDTTIKQNSVSIDEVNSSKSSSNDTESFESSSFAQLLNDKSSQKASENQNNAQSKDDKDDKAHKILGETTNKDKMLQDLLNLKDINMLTQGMTKHHKSRFSIDMDSLSDGDVKFVKELFNNPNAVITSFNQKTSEIMVSMDGKEVTASYKSFGVSKTLTDLIDYAYKSQKPVRLDIGNNSLVILRINDEGKLAAQFMSSDKAMESILKSSIPGLRSKLDSEGIPYKDISYKERDRNNKKEQERK